MKLSASLSEQDVERLDAYVERTGLGSRSAVIVSDDRANATAARLGRGVVTVVPVTSNVSRVYPFQVRLQPEATGLDLDSKAQAEQIRSVDTSRIGPVLGHVPVEAMAELDDAMRLHLQL